MSTFEEKDAINEEPKVRRLAQPVDKLDTKWVDVPKNDMPYEGKLYPANWQLQARPVEIVELRAFSGINEQDPLSVTDGLNSLVESNMRFIEKQEGRKNKIISAQNLYEDDRLWAIMTIHMYSGYGKKIKLTDNCANSTCKHENAVDFNAFAIQFAELSDIAQKYLNEVDGDFLVKTKSFGNFKFTPLTLGDSKLIREWIIQKTRNKEEYEMLFLEMLPWLLSNKELIKGKKLIDSMYYHYLSLSENEFLFYKTKLVPKFKFSPSSEINFVCEKCETVNTTVARFPNGLTDIFSNVDFDEEFV